MSSLHKFHRRTLSSSGAYIEPTTDVLAPTYALANGSGNNTAGYYLGSFSGGVKLYVAPKSTEVQLQWGSEGTIRNTTFVNNGIANTTTLHSFGSTAHPAAYYCKTLTTGGYNRWYLPAKNELFTLYSNQLLTPFATSNSFVGAEYLSSTDYADGAGKYVWSKNFSTGTGVNFKSAVIYVRAVRRSTV